MNAPRLIRPLRPLLQGKLPQPLARSVFPRFATQLRANSTVPEPPKPDTVSISNAATEPIIDAATEITKTPLPPPPPHLKAQETTSETTSETTEKDTDAPAKLRRTEKTEKDTKATKVSRYPRALEALYLAPLRREATYGVPTCDLQLRSYSIRNLEFYCDFALRAAYYLGLPAFGPIPLPRQTKKWTVIKSHFIFKKSQENFSRTTLRRLIQIRDGHPDSVQVWLAFLQKYAYYGVGMKANVWEFSKLGVSKTMDETAKATEKVLEETGVWDHLAHHNKKGLKGMEDLEALLAKERRLLDTGTRLR